MTGGEARGRQRRQRVAAAKIPRDQNCGIGRTEPQPSVGNLLVGAAIVDPKGDRRRRSSARRSCGSFPRTAGRRHLRHGSERPRRSTGAGPAPRPRARGSRRPRWAATAKSSPARTSRPACRPADRGGGFRHAHLGGLVDHHQKSPGAGPLFKQEYAVAPRTQGSWASQSPMSDLDSLRRSCPPLPAWPYPAARHPLSRGGHADGRYLGQHVLDGRVGERRHQHAERPAGLGVGLGQAEDGEARKCVLPVPGGPHTAVTRWPPMARHASRWLGVKPRLDLCRRPRCTPSPGGRAAASPWLPGLRQRPGTGHPPRLVQLFQELDQAVGGEIGEARVEQEALARARRLSLKGRA